MNTGIVSAPSRRQTNLYKAVPGRVDVVDVPEYMFAAVDGAGAPANGAFQSAIPALYSVAYGVRFALRDRGVDVKVAPLEALWSSPIGTGRWRAMIRLPWAADCDLVDAVRRAAAERHPERQRDLDTVSVVRWQEGLAAQTLHLGPYDAEAPSIDALATWIADHGYRPTGRHHEIYLSDPRRSAPDRLRTILRQPVEAR